MLCSKNEKFKSLPFPHGVRRQNPLPQHLIRFFFIICIYLLKISCSCALPWTGDHHLKLTRCVGRVLRVCDLDICSGNEIMKIHHLRRAISLQLCQVVTQQGGLARSRMVFARWGSSWTFYPWQGAITTLVYLYQQEVQVRQWELSEGRKVFFFQLCDWGQPVLYRAHSPHLHSPTALNYPLSFLRETEWQLSPVQQWERGGSRGLAEKSIHKWINCTNNFS